jgi:hypothetical protein
MYATFILSHHSSASSINATSLLAPLNKAHSQPANTYTFRPTSYDMVSPGTQIALLFLGLFLLLCLIAYYLSTRVNTFVKALINYRKRAQDGTQETNTADSAV